MFKTIFLTFFLLLPQFALSDTNNALHVPTYSEYDFEKSIESNRVEVIEFFWYGCPQAFALENDLVEFKDFYKEKIKFKRIHLTAPKFNEHARIFYTLQVMELDNKLHSEIMELYHEEGVYFKTSDEFLDAASFLDIDEVVFKKVYNSDVVTQLIERNFQISEEYRAFRSPFFAVGGRFFTTPAMSTDTIKVVKGLVDKVLSEK